MTTLYTLSLPALDLASAPYIEQLLLDRKKQRSFSGPLRIPVVYGCSTVGTPTYIAHVKAVAAKQRPIPITCSKLALYTRTEKRVDISILVDKGSAELSALYDDLHVGVLAPHRKSSRVYISQMRLLSTRDSAYAGQVLGDAAAVPFSVRGVVDALSVCSIEDRGLHIHATITL